MPVILTCYYKPKLGGLCKRLIRSMNALLERGHSVHYLAVKKFPVYHKNCFFHRFPWPESKTDNVIFWFFFHTLAPMILLYLGFRHNISHAYTFSTSYGFPMQLLRITKGIPLTIFLRADILKNHALKGKHKIIILLDTLLEGMAIFNTNIHGVSKTLLDSVLIRHSFFNPDKTGVLPNDIISPSVSFRKEEFKTLPIKIAAVGIIEERKNLAILLKAFTDIPKSKAHLYIFGLGPMENKIKQLISKLKLSDRVTLMGWVDDSESIWKTMDILAFPSLHEGSPNAVLEALAYHTPVIASDIPEHRELLPADYLLDPLDAVAWTDKFAEIASNPAQCLSKIYKDCSVQTRKLSFDWDTKIVEIIICI